MREGRRRGPVGASFDVRIMEVIIDNVSEFDAKAADRIITEYNSLLDEATLKDMHISAVLAAMEENGGVNVDALLKRAQVRSSLCFSFFSV